MSLFLRRLHQLRQCTTQLPSSIPRRLLSTASTSLSPPPKRHFAALDYLIRSCGLSSDEALRASKKIDHLKSPGKPDAVLRFLRETGVAESDIRAAVLREPRVLISSVEKNWRQNVAKLLAVGFSIEDISGTISRSPYLFLFNIESKIDFWMQALGSIENLSVILRSSPSVLRYSLEKVLVPNLSFLQEQLGLAVSQIVRLIRLDPFFITLTPQALMIKAKKAEKLGVRSSSPTFLYALVVVHTLSDRTVDARINNLRCLGFSQEEVTAIVSNLPFVLKVTEELMGRKIKFLFNEMGYNTSYVVHNPVLITLSLEKRLIPRSLVKKLLELKGLPGANRKFISFAVPTEGRFTEKFVLPYEDAIPGLHQAYVDACAGNIVGTEWFSSILS